MKAAGLDEQITLEKSTFVPDGGGGGTHEWQPYATVWAKAIHKSGDETVRAAHINATRTVRFKTRFRGDIDPEHRLQWRGATYNIYDIDESARRNDELWITGTST